MPTPTTSTELHARRAALDEAFFLVLFHPEPLAKLRELISEAEAARLSCWQRECNDLSDSLPPLTAIEQQRASLAYISRPV